MDGFQCTTCHKTFGRQEHLKRHEQSHKAAQFHCSVCSKAFRRRDALKKHQQNHLLNDASLRQRGARACSSCATSKARCTGDLPCARCLSKQLQCEYPTKKIRSVDDGPVGLQDQHVPNNATPPPPPSLVEDDAFTFAAHDHETGPVQHDLDSNMSPYTQPISQPNIAHVYNPQELYCDQPDAFYPPVDQHTVVENTDLGTNVMSTLNWLQMDAMSFNSDDIHNMFPYPSTDFSISAGVGFGTFTKGTAIPLPAGGPFPNVFDQRQQPPLPQLPNDLSDQTPIPTVLDSRLVTDDAIGHQLLSPMTISSVPTDEATVASGEYYVDGDAGRLPRSKRHSIPTRSMRSLKLVEEIDFTLEFPYPIPTNSHPGLNLSDEKYKQLCDLHVQLCLDTTMFKAYKSAAFPSNVNLQGLLFQYFSHFDQTMPMFHVSTFRAESTPGALLMSMMALGSAYLDCGDTETFSLSMQEFVRRYLVLRQERRYWPEESPRTLAQIHLLHAIGAGFTLYGPLYKSAAASLGLATRFCLNDWIPQVYGEEHRPRNISPDWMVWLNNEESLRTRFCIWLFDCMWAFHFHQKPHLTLDLAAAMNLPCVEKLWSASNATTWSRLAGSGPDAGAFDTPTFLEALQNLYIDKRLLPKLAEFSRILLIHGLIRRTSEVKATVTQSLSTFEPSAQKQTSSSVLPKAPSWPPSVPLFNKWRNSACDCLDILHWEANATVGAASGIEHPTILHLHLARILLLGPMREIVLFAGYLIRLSKDVIHSNSSNDYDLFPSTSPAAEAEGHCRLVQRWAAQDQYKARLAAIHAGVVFWHVRMYAINGFYEPTAVAFAALLLWALGAFTVKEDSQVDNDQDINTHRSGQGRVPSSAGAASAAPSADYCDIILIDRPTDDELVQQFVRQGQKMHVNITGVGNLFGPDGPRKVLAEGQKLLNNMKHWQGITNHWLRVLSRLENVTATVVNLAPGVNGTAGRATVSQVE